MHHSYDIDFVDGALWVVLMKWVQTSTHCRLGTECTRWLIPNTQIEED
jgi:hypothetical protein